MNPKSQQPTLWYFADPMCSWCWGFSPVISRIQKEFGDRIHIILNMGGLRPGTLEPISSALREEILHHWHEVHRLTGQPFRFDDAMPEGFVYDTEPASRAVLSFSKLLPNHTLDYFSAIQSAFYTLGRNVTQEDVLVDIASQFPINRQAFKTLFASDELHTLTQEHFQHSQQAGIRGFPSLIWQQGNKHEILSRGYLPWEDIAGRLNQRLSQGS